MMCRRLGKGGKPPTLDTTRGLTLKPPCTYPWCPRRGQQPTARGRSAGPCRAARTGSAAPGASCSCPIRGRRCQRRCRAAAPDPLGCREKNEETNDNGRNGRVAVRGWVGAYSACGQYTAVTGQPSSRLCDPNRRRVVDNDTLDRVPTAGRKERPGVAAEGGRADWLQYCVLFMG